MSNRNPTHGQKVDLGQNAPVKHEGPGEIPKESLAKESIKEGGEFAHNEGIQSENQPPSGHEGTSAGHHGKSFHSKSSGLEKTSTSHSASHSTNKSSESKASADHNTKKSSGLDKTSADHSTGHSTKKSAESENTSTSRATNKSSAPGSESKSKSKSSEGDHDHTYADAASGPHGENLKAPMGESNTDGLQKALASEPGSMNDPSRLAERQFQEHNNAVGREGGPRQAKIDSETPFDPLKSETSS